MDVLLIRHAKAFPATGSMRDEDRFLTPDGRESALRVGEKLAELGVTNAFVYTSPLVRAVQTAELVAFGVRPRRVEAHPPLAFDVGTTAQALSVLSRHEGHDVVVLVTHEPKVRALAATLAGTRSFPSFPTTGVAAFRGPRGATKFLYRLDPTTLGVSSTLDENDD